MRAQISQHAHRITCWSPLWGAGPLSGALLGDGASWSAPLPCKTTPTCLGTVRHLYRRPCIWGSGGVRSRRRPGAAGQVETQAAGRSSCSAVSSCPVVPSGRSVLGCVFSAAVLGAKNVCFGAKSYVLEPNRTFWNHNVLCTNSVAIGDLFRLQCVQMCTDVPSGSDISPSAVKAALQASGRRGSIVGVQISFRDPKPTRPRS